MIVPSILHVCALARCSWCDLLGTRSDATPASVAQFAPVAVTIDLSQAGATRCTNATSVPAVVLPPSVETSHVILPKYSPGGN
jgi:hypothetical protein